MTVGLSPARKQLEEDEVDDPEDLQIIKVQRAVTFGCSRHLTSLNEIYHQLETTLTNKLNTPIVISEG